MNFMGFYSEKPIRVDYYPKTKEDTDEPEKLEIKDSSDKESVCKTAGEKEPIEEETMKCNSCMAEDAGVIEKAIKEVAEGMEKVVEKVIKGKKEN